ncbi:MAG: TIGR03768 family metallophosphoesterase [Desulfobaccales bacterium]
MKYCAGAAAALGLDFSVLGTVDNGVASGGPLKLEAAAVNVPTYPINAEIFTTLQKTVVPAPPLPPYPGTIVLVPGQVSQYTTYGFGMWGKDAAGYPTGPGYPFVRPPMVLGGVNGPPPPAPSVRDPLAATLLTFFSISDIHITDKESPAQVPCMGYQYPSPTTPAGQSVGNSSGYSAIILSTTQVLDAAVQTINAVHQQSPFDFGLSLGDAANNTQHNELRWFIDVFDGQWIIPSSGAHLGAGSIGYQKPYQAAGLDKSIPWWQVVGNHDQFWMGSNHVTDYIRDTLVGSNVLNTGMPTSVPPNFSIVLSQRGLYMGCVDGATEYGDIIYAGPARDYPTPPQVVPDPDRRSLLLSDWMGEFFNTTSTPVGHGFTPELVQEGFACYHFYPKADIPIKFIVLDDTDKVGGGAAGALDQQRYEWLVNELDAGEAAGELMVICAHIPLLPYAQPQSPPPTNNPLYPLWPMWASTSYNADPSLFPSPDLFLRAKLHTYKNLILWLSGHVHRNCITPQPSPDPAHPEYGYWEVETPSLRDLPQQFRHFEILRNSDNTISIFTYTVDTAVNPAPAGNGSVSPAWTSRAYAIATQEIFQNPVQQGPNASPLSGVYNAELVQQLSPEMQAKLSQIGPVVSSFKINDGVISIPGPKVTLNNTVAGSTPTHYLASEDPAFNNAVWLPYSTAPTFTPSSRFKTVYLKVKDGSGKESAVVSSRLPNPLPAIMQLLLNN